jgi:hypothetical protein
MVTGARPGILLGTLNISLPDGIVLDMANLLENAPIVQHAREEPPLPEVAGHMLFGVKILRIAHVQGVEATGERSFGFGDTDEVDVILHQAIGPDLDGIAVGAFPQQGKVAPEIGLLLKDPLTVVPLLGNLVRVADDGGTGETGHLDKLPPMDAEGRRGDKDTSGHQSRNPCC